MDEKTRSSEGDDVEIEEEIKTSECHEMQATTSVTPCVDSSSVEDSGESSQIQNTTNSIPASEVSFTQDEHSQKTTDNDGEDMKAAEDGQNFSHDVFTPERSQSVTEAAPDTTLLCASDSQNPEALLIDVEDGSSSINRVLSWDPWGSLNLLKNDVLVIPPPKLHSPTDDDTTKRDPEAEQPIVASPRGNTSILKGSPRRVNSACTSSTMYSSENTHFEPLPIGDTTVDKHVQWRHEVQVTYYTFDSEGQVVVTTQVEPLHEESEQHARPLQYARANTKGLNVGARLEEWLQDLNLN